MKVAGGAAALALLVAGCDPAPPPPPPPPAATPALWSVADADSRVRLIGTVHQLPKGLDWDEGPVGRAIDQATLLVVELDPVEAAGAGAAFARLARADRPLPPLGERLPPALRPQLTLIIQRSGRQRRALDALPTWAAALTLAQTGAVDAELSPLRGVDTVLATRFEIAERPVRGLERADAQLRLFAALPEADQRAMLAHVVDTTARGAAPERMRAAIAAWSAGDQPALDRLTDADLAGLPGLRPRLLDQRNRAFADAVEGLLADDTDALVAVGAAHMGGPAGLPALLAARGHRVTRLQ